MNRPNFKDYLNKFHYENDYESYDAYINDLEKYCDTLEKALDKACECLEGFGQACADCPQCCVGSKRHGCQHCEKEDWKEWCLKDE